MSKRKPPSERPERQLDDTARAIARSQVNAKAKKTEEAQRQPANATPLGRLAKSIKPRKVSGPAPMPSTKRPKKV
jgi:hypothetical protein